MLDTHATQTLATLQRLLPDLVTLAAAKDGEFRINTTSPSGWPLWVWSEGEELIVGFAEWHGHFGLTEAPEQDASNVAAVFRRSLRSIRQSY